MNLINVNEEKCTGCNACIRTCPVTEACVSKRRHDGSFFVTVNHDKCIGCGECIRTCSHGARDYTDDTDTFMANVGKTPMAIIVAPAIKTILPSQWQKVLNWFKMKKVKVFDVSFGADICTWAHLRAIENNSVGNIISQPCAAIVNFIEMYHPELLTNLSPIHSPASCEAIYLKKHMDITCPIAMISPCVAKKKEFAETGLIDYNVTIKKMMEYFSNNGITFSNDDEHFEYDFQDSQGLLGSVYPRPGGLRDNIWLHNPEINITNSEGVNKVYSELEMYSQMPDFKHPEVFDVLSCEFGCNAGPASGSDQLLFDIMANMRDIEKSARKKRKTKGFFKEGADKQFKAFDDKLNLNDYIREYKKTKSISEVVSDKQIEEAFLLLEKTTDDEKTFNCHACGYKSCKEMATAIARKCNIPDNCIVYAKKSLEAKHERLIVGQSKIAVQVGKIGNISANLIKNVDDIKNSLGESSSMNTRLHSQADNISLMISMLISFCDGMETLDKKAIDKLLSMMNRIVDPLDKLLAQINDSSKQSEEINEDIQKIYNMAHDLDHILVD